MLFPMSMNWFGYIYTAKRIVNSLFALALISGFTLSAERSAENGGELRMATSTSLVDSGLMELLIPRFEEINDCSIKLYSVGTGTALRMGRAGTTDALIVHAPAAELKFMNESYGVDHRRVMHNDFVIIGPREDPADAKTAEKAAEVFQKIKQTESLFVSRADDSGTNKRELEVWKIAGINPVGNSWYFEYGGGMGTVVDYCNEQLGYTLVDRGTWLSMRKDSRVVLIFSGDPVLLNVYDIITVNPQKHDTVNSAAAKKFADWVTSEEVQSFIGTYKVDGEVLFTPSAEVR